MKYPFPKTTKTERKILDAIGSGNYVLSGVFVRSLNKHLERFIDEGWIRFVGEKVICNNRFGKVTIPEFAMPIRWHVQWCEWCAFKYPLEDL